MGCVCSDMYVEAKKDHDLVGQASGRSKRDIDINAVPNERRSMVHMELRAERETIYRPKDLTFERQNSLSYDDDRAHNMLRRLLDEPVGRFYFREYAVAKAVPGLKELIDCWTDIEILFANQGDRALDALATFIDDDDEPDSKNGEDSNRKRNSNSNNTTKHRKRKTVHVVVNVKPIDGGGNSNGADSSSTTPDEDVAKKADLIIEKYVMEGAPDALELKAEESIRRLDAVRAATCPLSGALSTKDDAKTVLAPLQNAVFREIIQSGHVDKFREHSEYKRYKMKIVKVYNAVSHRDFDFMRTLGKGSFGRVLGVRKKTTKQLYALKVMSKRKILSGAESSTQVTIERNVLVTCSGCRFIVKPYLAFQTTRALFLALELLEGGNLNAAMAEQGGTMELPIVRFHCAQVVLGLAYLHKHGIIYRDLKPLNVMLDRHGNAVLTDMGLCAKIRPSEFSKSVDAVNNTGQRLRERKSMKIVKPESLKCVGTYGFRAPEVLSVESSDASTRVGYGPAVDYWALGVMIYYLLEGKFPFKDKVNKVSIFRGNVDQKAGERRLQQNPRTFPEHFSTELVDVLHGLLNLDPTQRLGNNLDELKAHPFFSSIDWEALEAGKVKSPYKPPRLRGISPTDEPKFSGLVEAMSNFNGDNVLELFGGENDMQDEYSHVKRKDQRLFKDWDYFPDESLEADWELLHLNRGVRRDTYVMPS